MKLIYTLFLLLSLTCSWAVYSPVINFREDCVMIILNDKTKIQAVITDKDNAFTYYHLCDDESKKEKAIRNSKIKEIIQEESEEEAVEVIPCEKIILLNSDSINIQPIRTDSLNLYYRICGKTNTAERKLRLSFIKSREALLVEQNVVQHKSLSTSKKKNKNKQKRKPEKVILVFAVGFSMPFIIGILASVNYGLRAYPRAYVFGTLFVGIITALIEKVNSSKMFYFLISVLGSIVGFYVIPLLIALLFL
ncbi:hypothetical protein N9B82_06750 [Saprospiraceae bacterium]|nr:hypothetical protein [Saprospiraceae bacterium]